MDSYPSLLITELPLQFVLLNVLSTSEVFFFIILIICLLLLSAILSGSEVAYFSMDTKKWVELEEEIEPRHYAEIKKLFQFPKKLLATLLVSISFVNIANIIAMEYLLHGLMDFGGNKVLEFLIKLSIEASVLLMFAEIMPIIFANHNNKYVVRSFYKTIKVFSFIFYPFIYIMNNSTHFLEKKLAFLSKESLSAEELDHAIDLAVEDDTQDKQEINILKGIVKFGNITASEIMKPRLDVVAINQSASFDQLLELVRKNGYSRIPVFKDDFDEVQGVIYSKDLIAHLEKESSFGWNSLLREVLYVPENKKIDDLLAMFKKRRMHFAIVINEYGGSEGIVTLEDVLEVVIGEISDEFDEDKQSNFKKLNDTTFQINARTPLHEFCKYFDISRDYLEDADEIDTLGGFMLILFKKIPSNNDIFEYKSFVFQIENVEKNRIETVKVTVKLG